MADTLIPYSFVPGTKAMADEVNANFIALAKSVDDMKTFTNESIENFNAEFEASLDEFGGKVDGKLAPDMSNSCNVTNCIIAVPQRVKYTLLNGVLTIKSGTVIVIPDGFEADGVTRKFLYKTLQTDISEVLTGATVTKRFQFIGNNGTRCISYNAANIYSGPTPPTAANSQVWFDTSSNRIKHRANAATEDWRTDYLSLPLISGAYKNGTGYTVINDVFNGMGYIGSTVWVDKGVKGLAPNYRNPDGTFSNMLLEVSILQLWTNSSENLTNSYYCIAPNGTITRQTPATYNQDKNINLNSSNKEVVILPFAICNVTDGVITSFNKFSALALASKSDLVTKAEINLSNVVVDYSSGINIASGWRATKSGIVYYNLMTDTSVGSGTIAINGVRVVSNIQTGANRNHHEIGGTVFISPGQTLTAEGSIYSLVFYPYK